ncbi:hypothetical protein METBISCDRAFT_31786 [Metschnikowia bicuspidata]|uniref:Cystathionine beta-lyase n=1 Tax=Metschnikowia bicuspidata TaxID=27322 RepID=A0A4P9ZB27_9ASCO|nr:hypothetical protein METBISCDRAFT_31786 [Metschnikowia bicuspidata]
MTETKPHHIEIESVFSNSTDQYNASVPQLYQSATFKQDSLSNMGEYDYTRSGNPTHTHIFPVTSDEVIAGDDFFGGTHRLLTYMNAKGDLNVVHCYITDIDAMKASITPRTKMIFLESPTNPLIKVCDVKAICDHAHAVNPDLLSATKYLNGHHDIVAGVITTRDPSVAERLYLVINSMGCGLSLFHCWLLSRGLCTLAVRVERQQQNCRKTAHFLELFGFNVHYPVLHSHPQYELHLRQCSGDGAVLSFETGSVKLLEKIFEACDIFGIAVSFGCVNSLISMPCKMSHASIDAKTREERDMPEDLIRLCIGIKNIDDLI